MKWNGLNEQSSSKDLRPTYEEVYDGKLQIDWRARKAGYYSSDKSTALLSYSDTDAQLENQIPAMVLEICKLCFNNEIINGFEHKERAIQFEEERSKRLEKEYAEKQRKLGEKRKAQQESLINELPQHANNWFKRNQLLKFADELENYLVNSEVEDPANLLQKYIRLVRENADQCNPLDRILDEMRALDLPEES